MRKASRQRTKSANRFNGQRTTREKRLALEGLEPRCMLTVNPPILPPDPSDDPVPDPVPVGSSSDWWDSAYASDTDALAADAASTPPSAPTLAQATPFRIRQAYGIDQITFGGVTGQGQGQTIAIVTNGDFIPGYDITKDANGNYNDLQQFYDDVNKFSSQYLNYLGPNMGMNNGVDPNPNNLPTLKFYNRAFANPDPKARHEALVDIEWAHAIAPKANILIVQATASNLESLMNAVRTAGNLYASHKVSVVSVSFGSKELNKDFSQYDDRLNNPNVTFVGAVGDPVEIANQGGQGWSTYPGGMATGLVAVGGTVLKVDKDGRYITETPFAQYPQGRSGRSVPDVSMQAGWVDLTGTGTGPRTYSPLIVQGGGDGASGASMAAPMFAGLVAIANQGRARFTRPAVKLDGNTAIFDQSTWFRDVAPGGTDNATGRGSPRADMMVYAIANQGYTTNLYDTTLDPLVLNAAAIPESKVNGVTYPVVAPGSPFTISVGTNTAASKAVEVWRDTNTLQGIQTTSSVVNGVTIPADARVLNDIYETINGWWGNTSPMQAPTTLSSDLYTPLWVRAQAPSGLWSPYFELKVIVNDPPKVTSLAVSGSTGDGAALGSQFKLSATTFDSDRDTNDVFNSKASTVTFYRDDPTPAPGGTAGVWDTLDPQVGGSPVGPNASGVYTSGNIPADSTTGTARYFARAKDDRGIYSAALSKVITFTPPPTISGSITITPPVPGRIVPGRTAKFTVTGVAEVSPDTITGAEFYNDKGTTPGTVTPPTDLLIAAGGRTVSTSTASWTAIVSAATTLNAALFPQGTKPYFAARAKDNHGVWSVSSPYTNAMYIDKLPTVGTLAFAPSSSVPQKNTITKISVAVSDTDSPTKVAATGGVDTVYFYRDKKTSGVIGQWDTGDYKLGPGSFNSATGKWEIINVTTNATATAPAWPVDVDGDGNLVVGGTIIYAVAKDTDGGTIAKIGKMTITPPATSGSQAPIEALTDPGGDEGISIDADQVVVTYDENGNEVTEDGSSFAASSPQQSSFAAGSGTSSFSTASFDATAFALALDDGTSDAAFDEYPSPDGCWSDDQTLSADDTISLDSPEQYGDAPQYENSEVVLNSSEDTWSDALETTLGGDELEEILELLV